MSIQIDNYNSLTITPAKGKNPRKLYEHQTKAIAALNGINRKCEFSALLVLPTGGGKTLTAVYWLLQNAVDKGKKILWIAHRHLLLEQAADTFAKNAYTGEMINHTVFNYRIISGLHDKPVHIRKTDNILIASKDSLIRRPDKLDEWLKNEDIYLVIDEAHHAVAKSYKKLIRHIRERAASVKMLGLTATPFRTSEDEKGELKRIFTDDIIYKISLNELINKDILSKPHYENMLTEVSFTEGLGLNDLKSINQLDVLPEGIAKQISDNAQRNRLIVETYCKKQKQYGQTIVFAINQTHAIALNKLFKKYNIHSDYIISSVRDMVTGITVSNKDNEEKIEQYRSGKLQVLINVNILTEGTDLPQTQTVFLTRPTTSMVLMTQMVGRALRGEQAGGSKDAYIVSFIDEWSDKIAWVIPDVLTPPDGKEPKVTDSERRKTAVRLIAISKIEEFAMLANAYVDTSALERIEMIERIPLGMYLMHTLEWSRQILVYNSTMEAYSGLIDDLGGIMEEFGIEEETIPDELLDRMTDYCMEEYFSEGMIPACDRGDIRYLLEFYAQKDCKPKFVSLDELDRRKLDVSDIAKRIYAEDMRRSEIAEYLDSLWENGDSIIRVYYSSYYFFKRMVDIELDKLDGMIEPQPELPKSEAGKRSIEELPLSEIIRLYPKIGIPLKEKVYAKAKKPDGSYVCAGCGQTFRTRKYLQVDHIHPMSQGGLTIEGNLQVLCRSCNALKSDRTEQ